MNYTVTIQSAPPSAPFYTSNVCDPHHSNTSCYCTNSKPPLQYLQDANRTIQKIVIHTANVTVYIITYIYEAGICFEAVGTEKFSLTEGVVSKHKNIEYSFFDSNGAFVVKGSNTTLQIYLFPRYPVGAYWTQTYDTPISLTNAITYDYKISNSLVYINEQVSGAKKSTTLNPYFQIGTVATYGIVIQNLSPTGK